MIWRPSIHTRDISRTNVTTPSLQWASTRPIQGQRDCHKWYGDLQYIHEIYPGPTWLRQAFNELLQDLSKANVTDINDQQTFNTYTRYIQDQRDYAKPSMSFYETYPGPIRQHSMTSTRHTWLSPTIRQHSMSFYETYPRRTWLLPYTICRPSIHTRGISRTNVTRPT